MVPLEELETVHTVTIITVGPPTRSTAILTRLAVQIGSLVAQEHAGEGVIFRPTAFMEGICSTCGKNQGKIILHMVAKRTAENGEKGQAFLRPE